MTKMLKIVYRGGNHFTVCSGEPEIGEHYDVMEEWISPENEVNDEWVKTKIKEGKVAPPFEKWHCETCRQKGDKNCNCSHCGKD